MSSDINFFNECITSPSSLMAVTFNYELAIFYNSEWYAVIIYWGYQFQLFRISKAVIAISHTTEDLDI